MPKATPNQWNGATKYLLVYGIISLINFCLVFLRCEWLAIGGGVAAKRLFDRLIESVLRAPMAFFETSSFGRVINRFSFDTESNDYLVCDYGICVYLCVCVCVCVCVCMCV